MLTSGRSDRYNASLLLDVQLQAGRGAAPALYFEGRCIRYQELYGAVCRFARYLRACGVRPESRVMLVLDDTPNFAIAFFGAIRMGAIPVPVNPRHRPDEFRYLAEDCGATAIITEIAYEPGLEIAFHGMHDAPSIWTTVRVAEAMTAHAPEVAPANTHRDDVAFFQYSSGSTGWPKGIVHLQHDMLYSAETYARHVLQLRPEDKVFARLLFHGYGLGAALVFPFWAGASAVLFANGPTPANLLGVIAHHRPSLLFSVPTMYNAILRDAASEGADLSCLRLCISAAEPLPPEVWTRWRDRFGHSILDGIGSTELFHIFCSNSAGDVRPGSSGKAVPGYELKIIQEDGTPAPTGSVGSLWVKGDSAAPSYWRQHEKSKRTMVGEWTGTGDLYTLDAEGYYWYQGRADDMMKVGGEWVSPIRIENALLEHPAVQEAAVVGETSGGLTRIRAFVVAWKGSRPPDQELQEWCKARLHRYEYPHYINYCLEVPKTASGKIQRFKLRNIEVSNGI